MIYNLFNRRKTTKLAPLVKLVKNKALNKVLMLLLSFFTFGLIYFFFCADTEFEGINIVQDELKDEAVKKYVDKVKKNELTLRSEKKIATQIQSGNVDIETDDTLKNVVVPDTEIIPDNVTKKHPLQEFYDRFYFAVVTGTTLGYGDIRPASNKVKFLTLCQLMTTIYVLVS